MRLTITIELARTPKRESRPESHLGGSGQIAPRVRGPYAGKPALGFGPDPRKKDHGQH